MSNILKLFVEKGFLLDKDLLEFLNELGDKEVASEIVNKIAVTSHKRVITKNLVDENIDRIKPILFGLDNEKKKLVDKYFVNISINVEVKKESSVEENVEKSVEKEVDFGSVDSERIERGVVKVLSSPVLASQKLEVRDFVRHFRNRYVFLKGILQQRIELENLTSIDKISGNQDFSIIGIVTDKRVTKNKNIILEVEDLTGKTNLLITQTKEEVFKKSKEILLDDIIGFKCSGSKDFLFVNDFFYPDVFVKDKNRTKDDVYVLFVSDFHIGSGNFLEKNFSKFINWLSGEGCDAKEKETLKKIKYMFVVGDSIDGVGIYPGQEKDLVVGDIKEQYSILSDFYKKIPKHISIIQCAGQHDAVRVAEPQPPIAEDFGELLHEIDNLYLVSNPSMIEVEGGVKILMYHGASMHGIINEVEELRLSNAHSTPAKVVKHLLLRRHLAPSHGVTTYIPNATEDPMLIREVPDVVTTGDLHRTDIDKYNGVLIVSNSCWQSITAFEEKVGNNPDPCKVPVLNLKNMSIKILDFSEDDSLEEDGRCSVKNECKEEGKVCKEEGKVCKEEGKVCKEEGEKIVC